MAKKKSNPVVFRAGNHIGEPGAEDDEKFLKECFVDRPELVELTDFESSKVLLLGRTGSGKTALLREIERREENVCLVDPAKVAFEHVENSTIVQFLLEIGANLSVLFQYLWKHVLLSEIIREYYGNRSSLMNALSVLDRKHAPVREYLEANKDSFWKEHDEILRETTQDFEISAKAEVEGQLGMPWAKIISTSDLGTVLKEGNRRQIQQRIQTELSKVRIKELNKALDAINFLMVKNSKRKLFVCIDELDTDWVNSVIKYSLIEALIDSTKAFGQLECVRIIVSLRTDVYDRVLRESTSEGIQPEKHEGRGMRMTWSKAELKILLDKRIGTLFKRTYTQSDVRTDDVFPAQIRSKASTIDFILDRTLMRPRDAIAFVNEILDASVGASEISVRRVLDAEAEYSRKRYSALLFEWRSMHPNLDYYLNLLRRMTGTNEVLSLIQRDRAEEFCYSILDQDETALVKDSMNVLASRYVGRNLDARLKALNFEVASILYKVGAIELKLRAGDHYLSSINNDAIVSSAQISEDATFHVHPMLWRALAITPNI